MLAVSMRVLALLAFGLALLLAQAAAAEIVSLHPFTPNLLLPIVIFLGVHQDVGLLRGALVSFLLGWLYDELCGSAMGLQTFVMVATYLVARGAGIRLFLRGPLFQVGLTFVAAMLAGGTMLALRAIFSPPEAFPLEMPPSGVAGSVVAFLGGTSEDDAPRIGSALGLTLVLVGSAATTAILSPFVFAAARAIETYRGRRREEAEAAR